jgi:hypothetical protein
MWAIRSLIVRRETSSMKRKMSIERSWRKLRAATREVP